jgi:hypothetical protein
MRRTLLIAAVVVLAAGITIGLSTESIGDGGYVLTVHVSSSTGPIKRAYCRGVGNQTQAENHLALLLEDRPFRTFPEAGEWSAVADPFEGQPLKVGMPVTVWKSAFRRKVYYLRYLVVFAELGDGSVVGKVVEAPEPGEAKEVSVSLP